MKKKIRMRPSKGGQRVSPPKMPIEIPEVEIKLERVSDDEEEAVERKRRKTVNREKDTTRAIPTASFRRMVREMAAEITEGKDIRWEGAALDALHEDAEMYLIETFHKANQSKNMCKNVTLGRQHMVQALGS